MKRVQQQTVRQAERIGKMREVNKSEYIFDQRRKLLYVEFAWMRPFAHIRQKWEPIHKCWMYR